MLCADCGPRAARALDADPGWCDYCAEPSPRYTRLVAPGVSVAAHVVLCHMSDQQTKPVLKLPIGDLVKAGANAPAVLVREVAQRRGPKLSAEAAGHRRSADFDVEEYVDRLIKRQLMLVRGQGALAGLAVVAPEAVAPSETVVSVGGAVPVALSGMAVTLIADLATCA